MAELLLRWLHFLAGITWIGLLYYFNFVQGPFMAEADEATKSAATQKLVPRALWWFRWSALLTFLSGAAIIGKRVGGSVNWSDPWTITIFTGALFGTVMLINVWGVIWRNQKIVIASAMAAASGGPANAAAPAPRGARSLRRGPTSCSPIPMLFFMGAATHHPLPGGGNHLAYWLGIIVPIGLFEINAVTATTGATTKPIEKIPGVIVTGFVVWAIAYALARAFLSV